MKLTLVGHDFHYEMENICRLFFPDQKFSDEDASIQAYSCREIGQQDTRLYAQAEVYGRKKTAEYCLANGCPAYDKECERLLGVALYECFSDLCGFYPQWGILTGVRPTKLLSAMVKAYGEQEAVRLFQEKWLVSEAKAQLCLATVRAEQAIVPLSAPHSFSLYLSIPFCTTRCSYCSFVSHSIERAAKLLPSYVQCLCQEIEATAQVANALKLRLETVYWGGGTPTTLHAEDLQRVMECIAAHFDLSTLREYTVEAGRPDTITAEKLRVLKNAGVTRISINPQTMQDTVLEQIGRRHTAQQVVEAYSMAREYGFDNINMDLIAGLPGDTQAGFEDTLQKVLRLDPENITVHTLARKRSARLNTVQQGLEAHSALAEGMLDYAGMHLMANGYLPYYLYRQSKMVGNLENVGWAKPGYEGLYNVFMMNELHTVLAVGAGAVTKLKAPHGDNIERVFNFKYPYEYIGRFEEMLCRKKKIGEYYEQYPAGN